MLFYKAVAVTLAPVFYPLCGTYHEMQGFGGSTYRPSYRHPGVATCSLGNPGYGNVAVSPIWLLWQLAITGYEETRW